MNLVPVQICHSKGVSIVLRNFAMGSVAWIDCLYVVKGPNNPRQAKKVVTALIAAIEDLDCENYFSWFSVKVMKGEFPVGAKVIDVPLRAASPARVQSWMKQNLPKLIEATEYDEDAWYQNNHSVVQKYGTFNPALDGAPCSVQ